MWLTSLLGLAGTAIKGIFGLKKAQGDAIQSAIKIVGDANASSAQREQAIATIIAAENNSGSWLAASWRPITMLVFLGMLVSFWFGYVPPGLMEPNMPPILGKLFDLLTLGLGGYMGARTFEKIVDKINVGRVLKKWIEKKFL